MRCTKCNTIIPAGRVNLGYKTCVNCSTVEQYGCAPITYHKTGNSIQIMSASDAAYMDKSQLTEKEVIKRVLIKDVRGVKVYGVWYK